jgi:hypothetical protein
MKLNLNIEKYLKNYAEKGAAIGGEIAAVRRGSKPWDYVVAVPACAEFDALPTLHKSLEAAAENSLCEPLIILVVNHRRSASIETKANNTATWDHFRTVLQTTAYSADLLANIPCLLGSYGSISYLVIDCFSNGREFPEKQGVGLARKIGSDIAVALIQSQIVSSPYIFNTDADASVGADYFNCSELSSGANSTETFLTPFIHTISPSASPAEALAIALYDRYLRLYVEGLKRAGSPYGFQTVGSTIGYHVNAYVAVRGFPRREAGEDFYLLNKLAKVGPIRERNVQPTVLQGRISYRVPFGTGASVGKISKMLELGEEYKIYDERTFDLLKIWLDNSHSYLADGSEVNFMQRLEEQIAALEIPGALAAVLAHLEETQAIEFLRIARKGAKKPAQILRSFTDWFDAFRTLKFVHAIRDNLLPAQPLSLVDSREA